MARASVLRYAWLIPNTHSNLTTPTHPSPRATIFSSAAAAYFLIFNRGFCSGARASSDSVNIKLGRKDQSRTEFTALLKSYDFSQAEIDKIVQKFPGILSCRVSTNLKPKLDYFVECGFTSSALRIVSTSYPRIFRSSLDSLLKPRYQFLKTYLKDEVNELIIRDSQLLCHSCIETNVHYLKKQGVPASSIAKLLAAYPRHLRWVNSRIVKWVEATKQLGIEPSAAMFPWYISMFGSMSDTSWKKKVEVFKSLGWSDEDIKATLLHHCVVFRVSKEKLRRNMDFYINNVKAELRDVIQYPIPLALSLNEKIIPRYEVMQLLKEYNLLTRWKMSTFFGASEKVFIRRYIEKNIEQVPHLHEVYRDSKKGKADAAGLNS